jgi:NTE family protein
MEPGLRSPRFWRCLSLTAMISPLNESRLDYAFGNQSHRFSPAFLAFDRVTQLFSPYEFNPFNLNPLKDPLEASIDFEALRESEHPIKLFLSATNVRTGKVKVFERYERIRRALRRRSSTESTRSVSTRL